MRTQYVLALCLILTGCADDDLPKYVELGSLRVLALTSDTTTPSGAAEYSPGDTVRITPWISDFKGGTRSITYSWQACVDPGIAVGIDPTCEGVAGATTLTTSALTVPATERTGSGNTIDVSIPSAILDNRTAIELYNGVSYLFTYRLTSDDGASVTSFKRILVTPSTKTGKNQNPTLSDILVGTTSLTTFPSGKVDLHASYPAGSLESYTSLKTDGSPETRTEELVTTWFITTGELKLFRTINDGTTEYDPEGARPTDHTPLLVGVMRDSRGGTSVLVRSGL